MKRNFLKSIGILALTLLITQVGTASNLCLYKGTSSQNTSFTGCPDSDNLFLRLILEDYQNTGPNYNRVRFVIEQKTPSGNWTEYFCNIENFQPHLDQWIPIPWTDAQYRIKSIGVAMGYTGMGSCSSYTPINGTNNKMRIFVSCNNPNDTIPFSQTTISVDVNNVNASAKINGTINEGLPFTDICVGSPIKLNDAGTHCEDRYSISIDETDQSGNIINSVYSSNWIISQFPNSVDLKQFVNFIPGKYYIVRFEVGQPNDYDSQYFYFKFKSNQNPSPSISVDKTDICVGEVVKFQVQNPPSNFGWTSTSGTTPNGTLDYISPTSSGVYNISTTETCVKLPPDITVDVNQLPTVDLSNNQANFCTDDLSPVQFTVNTSPSGGNGVWSMTGQGTITQNGVFDPSQYSMPNGFLLEYTYTDPNGCTNNDFHSFGYNTPPTLNTSATDVLCNGDQNGVISANGIGTSPLSYSIDGVSQTPPFNNLSPGNYNIEVEDGNGCTTDNNLTISEPNPVTASVNISSPYLVACNGDNAQVTVSAQGGVGNYEYDFGSGYVTNHNKNLPAQQNPYYINVKDGNNCLIPTPLNLDVNEPTEILPNEVINDASCNGVSDGSITLQTTGGVPGYSYQWSTGSTQSQISSLAGGTYYLTINDNNNCSEVFEFEVDNQQYNIQTSPVVTNETCFGSADGEINLTLNSSLPPVPTYTFDWSNGYSNTSQSSSSIDGLGSGTYTVTITNNSSGCSDIQSFEIEGAEANWQVYSQDSQSETKSVDVESDDNGNIYVTGYFEGSASFNNGDVTINSGSSPRGLFLVKYDKCANFEWVGYTTSGSAGSTNYEGVDIEYRNGEIIILGKTNDQNNPLNYFIKDNSNSIINSSNVVGATSGSPGYFIGRTSTDALTLSNFDFVDAGGQVSNEEFTSIDVMSSSNLIDFVLAGQNNGDLYITEVNYGTNGYVISPSNNYIGSNGNSINDIERRVGTQELYFTGEYTNSTLLGSSNTLLGSSDAYTAVITEVRNLPSVPSTSYIHVGEANQTATGNEVDINELATGEVQVYTTGHYNEALTGWNYPSASGGGMVSAGGIDNAFISSSTFEPQGPFIKNWAVDFTGNDFIEAEGLGIIYDESGDRILATGTFRSETITVPDQDFSAPGSHETSMWNLAISLNGELQWINSGIPDGSIEVAGIASYGVNGFIAGSHTSQVTLSYEYQSPTIPYVNSSGNITYEMFIARCGNALAQSQGSTQGQFYKKDPFADQPDNAVSRIQDNEHKFNVYPNPTRGNITIEWKSELEENWSVNIYSGTGVNVYSNSLNASNNMIKINEFSHLSKGVYFVKVSQGNLIETTRLVIQ
jgi:hypothetical protein